MPDAVKPVTRPVFEVVQPVVPANSKGDLLTHEDSTGWPISAADGEIETLGNIADSGSDGGPGAITGHLRTIAQAAAVLRKAVSTVDCGTGTDDEVAVAATPGLRLMGFSSTEDAGAAATLILHAAGSAASPVFAWSLAASESRSEWFGPQGLSAPNGIFLERVTGTSRVTVHYLVQS